MKNVLLITSSPRGESSYSSQVARELAEGIGSVTTQELWRNELPPIDHSFVAASFVPEADRSPEQRAILAQSEALIDELKQADVIVIAAGMINFGMPAALKNWVDHVSRKGLTFEYGETGPKGLLTGKRVILVLASGGVYSSGPMSSFDHLEPALRTNLSFMGLTDIEVVRIEGVGMGAEQIEIALSGARDRSRELVALAS